MLQQKTPRANGRLTTLDQPVDTNTFIDRLDQIPDEPADPAEGCCGEFARLAGPFQSMCKLCPASPTYWKTTGERVACPDYRPGEYTAFCPVCGYGPGSEGHRRKCEQPQTLDGQIAAAATYDDLVAIWEQAVAVGQWTDRLTVAACARKAELEASR